jgi:ribose 1,5-bisphosphate isomerase
MDMTLEETADDIRSMRVRGAAKISRAAAQAIRDVAMAFKGNSVEDMRNILREAAVTLLGTRPSAVSLRNGVNYTLAPLHDADTNDVESLRKKVSEKADEFIARSHEALKLIGEYGSRRIPQKGIVMTHCNSQAALSAILKAHDDGKDIRVYATESRPWKQGHITARALAEAGVPVTLIVDSAIRHFIDTVDIVIVGADTVTSSGTVINKIGTSVMALCAKESRVPVIVCAETYKFSPRSARGEMVEIEERDPAEVADPGAFPGVTIANPVFDVTPPEYITAIVTEKGLISPYAAFEIIKEFEGEFK